MNDKAVSPVIGFILIVMISITFIGIVQSVMLPQWNKAVEAEHLDELKRDVDKISEITTISASTGLGGKVVVKALTYPQRPFLISPKYSSVSISTKKLNVSINGNSYSTCAIVVKPNYYYLNKPILIYENNAVFEEYSNSSATIISESNSFSKNKITIYLINCSFSSFSTTQAVNLFLEPVSYGGQKYYENLNITFESYDEKTANEWRKSLKDFNVGGSGRIVTVNTANVSLTINEFVLLSSYTGEVVEKYTPKNLRLINLSNQSYDVYKGVTIPLGVRVVDEFENPVKNYDVSIADSCHQTSSKKSDENGEVWYYFNADDSGSCQVTFTVNSVQFDYNIEVSSPPPQSGIFTVDWLVGDSYYWNASVEGNAKDFEVKVKYEGNDVSDARVDFSTDNPDIVTLINSENQTNINGVTSVRVSCKENGTTNLFASCGGSGDVLSLIIENCGAGFCPAGWQYWREITITNTGSDLTNYQIKIELNNANFDFTHANSDGSDIRFYDSDRVTPLSYWIEEWDSSGGHAIVWVKVPSIPSGSKTIYMFYGNPSASSKSDVSKVFIPGKIAMFAYDWRNDLCGRYADSHYEFQRAVDSNPQKLDSEYVETLNWYHRGDGDSGAFGYFPFRAYDFMTLFKFLLVPGDRSVREVATDSDDASEILIDGTVTANWYGGHPPCGCWDHSYRININKPVWVEYRQQEWYGIEAAKMAIKFSGDDTWYVIDADNLPYNTKIFARKYAETEPSVSIGEEHTC